jgi:hypothetical protein
MIGGVIEGLVILNVDNYTPEPFHATLIAIAVVSFAILFNTVLAVRLPFIEGILLILHVSGLFAIIIPLWVTAPHGKARDTLLVFTNNGGWPSTGLSAMTGMSSIVGTLVGYDCSVHMCKLHHHSSILSSMAKSTSRMLAEEVKDASRTVPRTLLWSFLPNASMFIIMGATFIFCVGDLKSVFNSPIGQPFIQVFFNATHSHAGTTVMVVIILIMLLAAAIGETATSSRQLWSFARDKVSNRHRLCILPLSNCVSSDSGCPVLILPLSSDTWMEHSASRSHRMLPCDQPSVTYQPWFIGSIERHHFSRRHFNPLLLLPYDWLLSLATFIRRAFAAESLVPRSMGSTDQHCCTPLCHPYPILLRMASD